jgi:hypothetical protein
VLSGLCPMSKANDEESSEARGRFERALESRVAAFFGVSDAKQHGAGDRGATRLDCSSRPGPVMEKAHGVAMGGKRGHHNDRSATVRSNVESGARPNSGPRAAPDFGAPAERY